MEGTTIQGYSQGHLIVPYNRTIFIKETSCFRCFYTNSTFMPSWEGWIGTENSAPGVGEVPAVTQDAPGTSRSTVEDAQGSSTPVEHSETDDDAPGMSP